MQGVPWTVAGRNDKYVDWLSNNSAWVGGSLGWGGEVGSREFSFQVCDPCKISLHSKIGVTTAWIVWGNICVAASSFFSFFFLFSLPFLKIFCFFSLFFPLPFFFFFSFLLRLCSHPLSRFPYVKTAWKGHATHSLRGRWIYSCGS